MFLFEWNVIIEIDFLSMFQLTKLLAENHTRIIETTPIRMVCGIRKPVVQEVDRKQHSFHLILQVFFPLKFQTNEIDWQTAKTPCDPLLENIDLQSTHQPIAHRSTTTTTTTPIKSPTANDQQPNTIY